ncbi:MAG TPA: septum formation initiator family protein [Planctomycetota bacterium]|nr:septum formation initiator family protein [Planctomycetota bacterium]
MSARVRVLGGVAAALLVAGLVVYGGSALARVVSLQREVDTVERDIVTQRARADALARTVERLRNDPGYIEKLAREELGWVREGDTVLKFPSQK